MHLIRSVIMYFEHVKHFCFFLKLLIKNRWSKSTVQVPFPFPGTTGTGLLSPLRLLLRFLRSFKGRQQSTDASHITHPGCRCARGGELFGSYLRHCLSVTGIFFIKKSQKSIHFSIRNYRDRKFQKGLAVEEELRPTGHCRMGHARLGGGGTKAVLQ